MIEITRNYVSQEKYIEKVLQKVNMDKAKYVSSLVASHMKLSSSECPTSKEDKEEMKAVPYASIVGSLTYSMMSNPGKEHRTTMKWNIWYLVDTSRVCLCFGLG